MPKDRSQLTPDEPEDWAHLQSERRQGSGSTGYDRLPGEQARPPLRDDDPAGETIPDPQPSEGVGDRDAADGGRPEGTESSGH